jgi:protease-4
MSRKAKAFFLLAALFVVGLALVISLSGRLPSDSVLIVELDGLIEDQRPSGLAAQLTGPWVTRLDHIVDAIDTAKSDDRIAGVVVRIAEPDLGWAKVEEIRAHLLDFRASQKPLVCYLAGETPTNREYLLATACSEVWMVPTAILGVSGVMSTSTFVRGTLDKLGIEPNIYGIAEYKTYRNQFTEKKYTPAHREAVESLVNSIHQRYAEAAASGRKLTREQFANLLREGPYLSVEAQEKKLVDRLAYWDEVEDYFRDRTGDWSPVELNRYIREISNTGADIIAVVRATGAIEMGESRFDSWDGFIMGADSVAEDLRCAREDDSVKAIILRVDSPGGSAVASEIIRREVQRARESKPVVVSMSDVAASGGYWISMSADRIVAEPTTVTGSIGVVFGKVNIAGLYALLGLTTDHYATSENATLMWEQQNFTPAQRELVLRMMQDTYQSFTRGVAEGRKLRPEQVEKIAKGRVWSGAQAKDHGLVDEFGGFDRALAAARELAKIDAGRKVRLVRYPEERTLFQELFSFGGSGARKGDSLRARFNRLARARSLLEAKLPFELSIR